LSNCPFGFLKVAYSLYQLGRIKEAHDTIEPVLARFPENAGLRYDLACYACKLGNLKESMAYMEQAIDLAGTFVLRQKALDDPALEKLWVGIGDL
jgi:tetratricopeptide (TPR) repeat protein